MADLDDLLLLAAGRPSGSGRSRHSPVSRRHHRADGIESRDNDSDDDHGYSNRKLSGSQVPLKKRLDSADRDDEHSDDHGGGDDDGYDRERDSDDDSIGSDLYKDENDRRQLAQLTELEREMILTDRASKRSDKQMHDKLRGKNNQGRKSSPPPSQSRGTRSSTRAVGRTADRDGALNEIRAKRARQQDPETHHAARKGYSPVKRRAFTAATLGSSPNRPESGSQSDEGESGDDPMADSDDDDDKTSPKSKLPTFEDIKEITIRRSKLVKWFMEPFFEELIVGCFVRVGVGRSRTKSIYRLCMVRNVDSSDPNRSYKLENKTTHKYLNVTWGNESSAARWQMVAVSDSPPLRDEFDQWVREVEKGGGRMPTKQDIFEKKEAIQKTNSFVYSADTVKQMLQMKKSATWKPLNIAAEKERLRREVEVAKMKNDEAEVKRITARLQELEAARQAQEKDEKAHRLAEMNRKNRAENFKNASELKHDNKTLKAGDDGYDPFSRRWTMSRNYYAGKQNGQGKEPTTTVDGDAPPASSTGEATAATGEAATTAALQAAAGAGKLTDTSAPVDQGTESNTLHDFDLPISLVTLQKLGGPQGGQAGFMARKQRLEATVGRRVPVDDGRRHTLTLTVSDYKRRMGLL